MRRSPSTASTAARGARTQLAIVSGGHPHVRELVDWITVHPPSALDWAPLVVDLLGLGDDEGGGF